MTTKIMDIIEGCENYLGWQPPRRPGMSGRQSRSLEAQILTRAMAAARPSSDVTLENLALALEYSRRKRLPITSPAALLHRISPALQLAYTPAPVTDIAQAIVDAINWERDHEDPHSMQWIYRLTRAHHTGREAVLADWKADGRGI